MPGIQDYPKVEINFSPTVPSMKRIKDKTKIDVRYSVVSPFAFVHIYWDPKIYEVLYEIEEPRLDKTEMGYRDQILTAIRDMINYDTIVEKDREKLLEYIDKRFKIIAFELGLNMSYE